MEALIVDDDPAIRQIAKIGLERGGWTVREASDGQAALDEVAIKTPDLVLMDVMMPGMDGKELLRRLRENDGNTDLPVIAISARHDLDAELMSLGATGVLRKPFDPIGLPNVLASYVK